MIRLEFGRSIRTRDWREVARYCPRRLPIRSEVALTIDPHGVTFQSVVGLEEEEYLAARFVMDWFRQAFDYDPLWIINRFQHASVQ